MRDSVRQKEEDGSFTYIQKRLLLASLHDLYLEMKSTLLLDVSFTSFVVLRPRHCIFADYHSAHTICICPYHENMALIVSPLKIMSTVFSSFQSNKEIILHLCESAMCKDPSSDCYMRLCKSCSKTTQDKPSKLLEYIRDKTSNWDLEEQLTYRMWINNPCKLAVCKSDASTYLVEVDQMIEQYLPHSYRVQQQREFVKKKKEALTSKEALITFDFSEQYQSIMQRSHQSYKFFGEEVTLHVAHIFYKCEETQAIKTSFHVTISDLKKHDATTVNLCQEPLLRHLQKINPTVKHVIYITDGAPSHYKNKFNFANLTNHEKDFNLTAEWHMTPTAHGKSECDGFGGNVKKRVREASVRGEEIVNGWDFFKYLENHSDKFQNATFDFVSKETYQPAFDKLEQRYQHVRTIPGTQQYHAFFPMGENLIAAKLFSESCDVKLCKLKLTK